MPKRKRWNKHKSYPVDFYTKEEKIRVPITGLQVGELTLSHLEIEISAYKTTASKKSARLNISLCGRISKPIAPSFWTALIKFEGMGQELGVTKQPFFGNNLRGFDEFDSFVHGLGGNIHCGGEHYLTSLREISIASETFECPIQISARWIAHRKMFETMFEALIETTINGDQQSFTLEI